MTDPRPHATFNVYERRPLSRHLPETNPLPPPRCHPFQDGDVVEQRPATGPLSRVDGAWAPGVVFRERGVLVIREPETLDHVAKVWRRAIRRVWRDGVLVAAIAFPRNVQPAVPRWIREWASRELRGDR